VQVVLVVVELRVVGEGEERDIGGVNGDAELFANLALHGCIGSLQEFYATARHRPSAGQVAIFAA
jgi:hypothetical protein